MQERPLSSGDPDEKITDLNVNEEKEDTSKEDQLSKDMDNLSLNDEFGTANECRARKFTFDQLASATSNFKLKYLLGEGGFGRVYKGELASQTIAIKKLRQRSEQAIREFVVEILTLSHADHPNLVKLIGYCAEGEHRLLVYEHIPLRSLDRHLHDIIGEPLDWNTRMEIAAGAALGLLYLHDKMKPPIVFRDLKCSNILLDRGYRAKLCDFGLVKVGPNGDNTHISTNVTGTPGYCAPEYIMTGRLTFKADIYSFGVVLLEIVTGRKAVDLTKPYREQNLVRWATPFLGDRRKFSQVVDPMLQGRYPVRGLYQALTIAALCVQEKPDMRPAIAIADVSAALDYVASQKYDPQIHPVQNSPVFSSRAE